jgi:3D-(3,5/4)-trihydroxycyclohexane-1,2-dione acylhydrolase (decyclizing)
VTLALPQDVQAEAFDFPVHLFEERVHHIPRLRPDAELLERAAEWLAASRRPLLICGGGVLYSEAAEALDQFARQTGVPVAETQAGKGVLRWDHPQCVGPLGAAGGLAANRLAREADLVLAVGTRLGDFATASKTAFGDPNVRFVAINAAELDAHKHAALPLVCDARVGLEELGRALAARAYRVPAAYEARAEALREEWNGEVERVRRTGGGSTISQAEVIGLVNEAAAPEDTVVCAAGGLPGDLLKLWRTSRPGGYHLEYGYSTMGYEIAGGLGVKLAVPEREVFVMVGDGSYLMLSGELATSIQEGLKLIVVLLDNHGFACIDGLTRECGGDNHFNQFRLRDPASGLYDGPALPIDYAANAASLGAHVIRAQGRDGVAAALAEARRADRTTVVVIEIDPSVRVRGYESWWDVPIAEVSESERVQAARQAYEERRAGERWFV